MADKNSGFKWTFQRLGGLDQVVIKSGDDLCHLRELDPKLWVALSCPTTGLEFDSRTLSLIDTSRDGRIRRPELLAAVEWGCARLKNPGEMAEARTALRLDAIDDSSEEGRRLVATGRAILENLGKKDAEELTQEDVGKATAHASEQTFNGDGILPPLSVFGKPVSDFINDALSVVGGVEDASGEIGVNTEIAEAFMKTLRNWHDWRESVGQASTPLGDHTAEAWQLFSDLRDKINDYFLRCELAAYAPAAQDALNPGDSLGTPAVGLLDRKALSELPLARAVADRPLDMTSGINPAWRGKVDRFCELIKPLLASPGVLSRDDWKKIRDNFAPYAVAIAKKPAAVEATVTVPPTGSVDTLGEERIRNILESDVATRLKELAERDADVPAAASDIAEVERLVLYYKHLHRLIINFVSFEEFYSLRHGAAFQSGTLYIDGRACRLCMPAEKVEEHSVLAANSQLYLLYCQCSRGKKPGENAPAESMNIVAAVTAGDSDLLIQNRNGVFVDNQGKDWDATVVKIVSNPIGLWQALWSPYKRIGTMITDQISKYASDKQAGLMATAGQKIEQMTTAVTAPAPAAAPRFDIGRNVGIFAAVGIALGAIGTAVGSIANALFAMAWWQLPLLLVGLFVIVSGPSLLMAWLKLRQRTLGPLLEASGWAINGQVAINYTLSRRLTSVATLPENSTRSLNDPLARQRRWLLGVLLASAAVGALAVGGFLWWRAKNRVPGSTPPIPASALEAAK